jgi:enoyl-CoA hydratase/carnithine racemase
VFFFFFFSFLFFLVLRGIREAVECCNRDEEVKVVIIEGRGKGFCGGYDLQLYAEKEGENAGWQESDRKVFIFDDFE